MLGLLLFIIYSVVSWILFIYAANFYYLLYRSLRNDRPPPKRRFDEAPFVTVQLPIYNERYVALRLIKAVCSMRYPRDRIQIQVLDDSTDETRDICRYAVKFYSSKGYDIEYIHRSRRSGFKAGALRNALKSAKGELIAIFDADFTPPLNFLERTVPYFYSEDVGMVQTRWGHINEEYSTLTQAQALNLDLHFMIEQKARSHSELFMNFNGTAGIWRKSCITDSGGWRNALAEDFDLSFRAQLNGWRFVFLPQIVCRAELPVQINASKRQQFRWAKGAFECTSRLLRDLLSAELPLKTRVQGALQLTRHIVHPMLIVQFTLLPILMLLKFNLFPFAAVLSQLLLGPVIYIYALQRIWRQKWVKKLGAYFYLLLFGAGISVNNTKAILENLFRGRGSFLRTPKFGIVDKKDSWRDKKYVLPFTGMSFVELTLGIYGIIAILVALIARQFVFIPYLAIVTMSFLYVALLTFSHSSRAGFGEVKEVVSSLLRAERLDVRTVRYGRSRFNRQTNMQRRFSNRRFG